MTKFFTSIFILSLAIINISSSAQYSKVADCDSTIRDTYNNNPRDYIKRATTENAQRCLADAGFWDYRDSNGKLVFTGMYLDVTNRAAEAYMNRGTAADTAKKAEEARVAEQQKIDLQKKAEAIQAQNASQAQVQANSAASASTIPVTTNTSTSASMIPLNPNGSLNTNTPNNQVAALPKNDTISDSREPASADKFLIQSIYFLFALPFILFAISIVAAFLKVFKKPNQ